MIGFAPKNNFNSSAENYETCGWYYHAYDGNLYCQPGNTIRNSGWKHRGTEKNNWEVEVFFDMNKKTISFTIDGVSKGVAFSEVDTSQPLFPAICLYGKG